VHVSELRHGQNSEIPVLVEVVSSMSVASGRAETEAAWFVGDENQTTEAPRFDPAELSDLHSEGCEVTSYRTYQDASKR